MISSMFKSLDVPEEGMRLIEQAERIEIELHKLSEDVQATERKGEVNRITSYNVCYTKLLRFLL